MVQIRVAMNTSSSSWKIGGPLPPSIFLQIMKKRIVILSGLISFFISSTAFSQASNFEGFTAGFNLSAIGGTTEISGAGNSVNYGQQSFVPGAEIGYNFAATNNVVLGITATYDFSDIKLGQDGDLNFKGQNRMSLNFKPGYVVSPNTIIYATVGYNTMDVKASIPSSSNTKNLSGVGYGLGAAVMLTKNTFFKAEVQQVSFNSWNDGASLTPSLTIGTVGIGYKF